jgi:hypothetical protein
LGAPNGSCSLSDVGRECPDKGVAAARRNSSGSTWTIYGKLGYLESLDPSNREFEILERQSCHLARLG